MRRTAVLALLIITGNGACVSVGSRDSPPGLRHRANHTSKPADCREHQSFAARDAVCGRYRARRWDQAWTPACGRVSPRWTSIVIHHSATANGGAKAFDRYHRERGWDELGYHFVIGNGTYSPDGYVEVGSRWHKQKHGAHCRTPSNYYNEHGIGICLVGDFNESPPTPNQLASLESLVRFLRAACDIPSTRVTTHHHINEKTECPGRFFSLGNLRRSLDSPITATSMP